MPANGEYIGRSQDEKDEYNYTLAKFRRMGEATMGIEGLEHLQRDAEQVKKAISEELDDGNVYVAPKKEPSQWVAETLQDGCRQLVFNYVNQMFDKSDPQIVFTLENVYVVWFSKTLKNHKALLSTTLSDGKYYEVTYNGEEAEYYLDVYVKIDNKRIGA